MSVKIEEAEITTSEGVRKIKELFENLSANIRKDLKNFSTGMFFCVVNHDNGKFRNDIDFAEWKTDSARIAYKNGEIVLTTFKGMYEECTYELDVSEFWRIKKMDFTGFWEEFLKFVEQYNEFSKEKDEEIKEFLHRVEFTEIY
jgi:hypothetical protein